jgi:glycosyltransferase involved in cell wall biosynthesis
MEKNEVNKNSRGGSELMQERLHNSLPSDLLDKFQIILSRVRDLKEDKKKILWLHDLPNDPESQHLTEAKNRKRFDKIVCVSNWQMQLYNLMSGVPYQDCMVIKNAIVPIDIDQKEYDGTVRLIYHTTPHRGLEILVPVFEELCNTFDNLHLDVYSSFSVYGWEQRDEQYKALFDRCRAHPKITYHGGVSNEEVREALKKSHIYAYPCIWPETSCLSVVEAMSAKNLVVCPNFAALPETCSNFAMMYPWNENPNVHAVQFAHTMDNAIRTIIKNAGDTNPYLDFQKQYFDYFYNWELRKGEWLALLQMLDAMPPAEQNDSESLVYRTS